MAAQRLLFAQVISTLVLSVSFFSQFSKFVCYFIGILIDYVCVNLLRFKPRLLLEKLRGKRLMFVGDSLNRNQWESMICLVQSAVPQGRKSLNKTGSISIFRIEVCLFIHFFRRCSK